MFDDFAVTPDISRQASARVFDHHFLDGGLERHLGALFQWHFENICWRLREYRGNTGTDT
jgi:hypothetical protein